MGNIYTFASEGGTPNTTVESYYKNGKIPFLKIEDTEEKYVYKTKNFITEKGLKNSSAWLIKPNSIIYTNGATIGNVSINKIPLTTKQGILGIELNKNFQNEFIFYLLNTRIIKEKINKNISVGTIPTLILKNFDLITFKKPFSYNEQVKIANLFSSIDSLLSLHKRKCILLKNIRKSLFYKMFPSQNSVIFPLKFEKATHTWEQDVMGNIYAFGKTGGT
ncbi:restriction endonuclease subunit S, partial [Mycoplasma sp. 5370]